MKPAAFTYHLPSSLEEALEMLADLGPEARPLAGGQSLVPMMNFRLAQPSALIDLNRIPSLAYLRMEEAALHIGAMTRHRVLECSPVVREHWPLISEAMPHVAHVQIRNRGTIGGSLAHADPAAEMPAVMTALDARLVLQSRTGRRTIACEDFCLGIFMTAIEPDELLVEVEIPLLPRGTGWAFDELNRRRGDFALVGTAALLSLDENGRIGHVRLAFTGVGNGPHRARGAENALRGQLPSPAALKEAAHIAAGELEPSSDLHASAEYRRDLSQVMAERVLRLASTRAKRQ